VPTGVNVAGMFSISMRVVDGSDKPVTSIAAGEHGIRHNVDIENISTMARSARVRAILPHGTARIAFHCEGSHAASWDQSVDDIPPKETRTLECTLVRTKGPARSNEPIQCDKVYERRGALPWEEKPGKLPFQITINAL
jgi:hypothetical protein